MKRRVRRSLELQMDILKMIKRDPVPTHIMQGTSLNWKSLQRYLKILIAQGLVTCREEVGVRRYYLTSRGQEALRLFKGRNTQ